MHKWRIAAACASFMLMLGAIGVRAEHTRRWRQSTYEEFMKGTAHGVAVRSDGKLEIAPKFTELADADASYLFALRQDAKGTLYAAGGSPANVFRLDGNGKVTSVFQSTDLAAQALAFDSKGQLYVGTSPDGKVYRVSENGEKSVFFDPKTKYIWDLAFAPDGTLYVATGDKGQIFAVTPDGKGRVFYASEEAHIRVLAFDAQGNLIAGTEPNGRILRLTLANGTAEGKEKAKQEAQGFVLYETPKREVTALAIGADGSIYAAAIGEKQAKAVVGTTMVVTPAPVTPAITGGGNVPLAEHPAGVIQGPGPFVAFPPLMTSSIYRIAPDGAPEELWSSREEVVYSLGIGPDGRVLAGTGNNGALLAIDGKGVFAQLAKASSSQITGILKGDGGKVYLCTANPGKLVQLGPGYETEGTYESRSFDAKLFSRWGRIEWWSPLLATMATSTKAKKNAPRLDFFVRSGNTDDPGKEWSRWYGPYTSPDSVVEAPPARFIQWKAVIHDGQPGDGIDWVSLAYQPRNVAPVIDGIALQDPGVRAVSLPVVTAGQAASVALKMPPSPPTSGVTITVVSGASPAKFENPPQGYVQKGWQSVLWSAHDDNDDDLEFAVYYRGEGEKDWKLLKTKLDQHFYSFDTTSLPDGAYYLKIVADDSPSNPPAEALKTERTSERFVVDNTPPTVTNLEVALTPTPQGATQSASARVSFTAKDNLSAIARAQYSLDGGDWILVAPKTGISDYREESYEFTLSTLKPGEHTIAVRAYDQFKNVGSGKSVFVVSGAKP
jgi:outer membrane protein assembly factor BamB